MKTKLNVRFLRKIQKHILAEPMRLDMMAFAEVDLNETFNPPCGTTGCIAGWGLILNGSRSKTVAAMDHTKVASRASRLLGLDFTPTPGADGWFAHWLETSRANDENSVRLFLVDFWPKKFKDSYKRLNNEMNARIYTERVTRKQVASLKRRLAQITSSRIDHFIATGE